MYSFVHLYSVTQLPGHLKKILKELPKEVWKSYTSACEFQGKASECTQHLGQIPKAVTGAACPTLAQPQLTEMDSPEWNETHKAPCTPCQGLYQTEINGRLHSLWAPKLQGQIQYLGGLWESLIGLGGVCVCLTSFNQVSQQQTLGVKWSVSGREAFQSGQKVGEAVGLRARPSHSVNAS